MIPNLIASFEEYGDHIILNENLVDDGEGGQATAWVPGLHFKAAVILDDSTDMLLAQSQGVTGDYSVMVAKKIRLPWHTVFKRVADNKIFRVTSKDDFAPPNGSGIDLRSVRAEEWELPRND